MYRLRTVTRHRFLSLLIAAVAFGIGAFGPTLDAASLDGRYRIVRLEIESVGGAAAQGRTIFGALTFDGNGAYRLTSPSIDAEGAYQVQEDGSFSFEDPSRPGVRVQAAVSADQMAFAGVAIDAAPGLVDLMVGVRESEIPADAALDGDYTLGAFRLPGAGPAGLSSALVAFSASRAGALTGIEEVGHFLDAPNQRQTRTPSSYEVREDGSIAADLTGLTHAGEQLDLFVSADGNYVIGAPAGAPGIVVGSKNLDQDVPESFVALYASARIGFDGEGFFAGIGSTVLRRGEDGLTARRLRLPEGTVDFSGRSHLVLTDEGAAWLSPAPFSGGPNMAMGVPDDLFVANAAAGAGVDVAGQRSDDFGVFFLLRPPFPQPGPGLFVDSRGIVNGASFARPPAPLAPGVLGTIFGSELVAPGGPDQAVAAETPLPLELAGVRVTVGGLPAPLLFVSAKQINFQTPAEASPGPATIVISNSEDQVEVSARLAPTSPALFSYIAQQSSYAAIVSHADGSLVTPANPARPGETVVFWATGFGVTDPPGESGVPNPGGGGERLVIPVDSGIQLLIAGAPAAIHFVGGAPHFVGLSQINATIPLDAPAGPTVPVALLTSHAIQDLSDLPIGGAPALQAEQGHDPSHRPGRVRSVWTAP